MKITSYVCLIVLMLSAFGFGQKQMTSQKSLLPELYQSLKHLNIIPFREERTVGSLGIPIKSNIFFAHNIGLNKTFK
ncbi:hypothetical protein [Croceitalea sp. P059]|uniref:hypothetical protein n=1 Tax=Croceitalea sp. P059 TaxID=3075601 RepID=UPI002883DE50|nr:hypothetical protein [Croceitalea sp. P059]MDT0539727.1 hypothetical protein [Croceitalea sp. P059]